MNNNNGTDEKTNGSGAPGRHAGNESLFANFPRGNPNIVSLLIEGTKNPIDYMVRSNLSKQELARKRRITAKRNVIYFGNSYMHDLQVMDWVGRRSVDAFSTKVVEHVLSGGDSILDKIPFKRGKRKDIDKQEIS